MPLFEMTMKPPVEFTISQQVRVGFTGTQHGMTVDQWETAAMKLLGADWLHHGDCIGGDKQMHEVAERFKIKTALFPPTNESKRAFCKGDIIYPPKDYISRNHDIVYTVSRMIAAPREFEERLRSGTWATIRYTLRVGKPLLIVWPDGTTSAQTGLPSFYSWGKAAR